LFLEEEDEKRGNLKTLTASNLSLSVPDKAVSEKQDNHIFQSSKKWYHGMSSYYRGDDVATTRIKSKSKAIKWHIILSFTVTPIS
jgi:hypothetical protein